MYFDNKRLLLDIFWIILGAVLTVLSVTEVVNPGIYAGMGGALMAVGALHTWRIIKYRKDNEYREKIDIELQDERNKFLRLNSWAWTGYIVTMVLATGCLIALVMGEKTVQIVLGLSVGLILVVYWIVYLVLSKKY